MAIASRTPSASDVRRDAILIEDNSDNEIRTTDGKKSFRRQFCPTKNLRDYLEHHVRRYSTKVATTNNQMQLSVITRRRVLLRVLGEIDRLPRDNEPLTATCCT
jgi:hypothetical protein